MKKKKKEKTFLNNPCFPSKAGCQTFPLDIFPVSYLLPPESADTNVNLASLRLISPYPVALRMAKTSLSFGHSECNRVK